jgi:uncharacterized phage protein (TIGR02218 family)
MKSVIVDYRYRCHCVRIECAGGLIVRLTDYPRDIVMSSSEVYLTQSGYQFSGNQAGTGMAANVMDIEGVANIAGVHRDAVQSGVFDGARLYAFATTWRTPVEDEEPIGAAILGKTTLLDDRYRIEMMSLVDAFNQSVGDTYTAACSHEFGDAECAVDLVPITVTGTLTSVTSNSVVRDSARTEALDYFGAGTIAYTSGDNAGLKPLEIKSYAADGTVTTFEPAYYPVQVGDAYTMIPGCRKRRPEDCRDKWNNILNHFGFSDIPTSSQYAQVGTK